MNTLYFKSESNHQEVTLLHSNYIFDISVEQILLAVLGGNKLLIYPEDIQMSSKDSYEFLNEQGLTYLSGTPSQMLLIDFNRLKTLKTLHIGAESIRKTHFEHIRDGFSGLIVTGYGTTETTIYNFVKSFSTKDEYVNSIGNPMTNVRFYVLDELLRMVPIGAVGEIYLSGECLARAYSNRPEENAIRFINNPFLSDEEKADGCETRMYKTGDLVRWNYSERLEYIGREDNQVNFLF